MLTNLVIQCFNHSKQKVKPITNSEVLCRFASKKTGSTTQNSGNSRAKHRGWKRQDGHYVQQGTILVTQRTTRFHPGLNVGFGRNGTLFAMERGKVVVTCEKTNSNWDHSWIIKNYEGRENQTIYKKYYNVITDPEHQKFKLIDKI